MKNKKNWLTLLFFAAVTAATVWAVCAGRPMRRRHSGRGIHAALPASRVENTAKSVISWRDGRTTLIRRDGQWLLEERGGRPASSVRVAALLNSLTGLTPVKEIQNVTPEILRELRLVDRDPEQIPGVRVKLYDRENRVLFDLLLGKGHFVRPEPGLPPSPDAEGRYVLTGGKVYLLPVVFENCHPVPAGWVDQLHLNELRKALVMTVRRLENGQKKILWSVFRSSTAHPFLMSAPKHGSPAENQLLSGMADRLSKPFTADYYIPKQGERFTPKYELLIRCADGFVYQLELAPGNAEFDIASLTVQYSASAVQRFPGETDPQYQRRLQELEQRFKRERDFTAGQYFQADRDLARMLEIVPEKPTGKAPPGPFPGNPAKN